MTFRFEAMRTVSNVDQQAQPYFVRLLHAPVKPLFEFSELQNAWGGTTPARRAVSYRVSEESKKRNIEIGKRIFEKLNWRCNTREFSIALHRDGIKLLKKLVAYGCVVCVAKSAGIAPAKWQWVGRKAN